MRVAHAALVAVIAACGPKGPPPSCATNVSLCGAEDRPKAVAPVVPADAPAVSQDEKLAAIQKAMNELDEGAQLCWAIAATDRFDIEGQVAVMVDIDASGHGKASIATDTARNQKLSGCLVELFGAYRWAPPLYGEAVQLPFSFKAPAGQSVIDRRHVEWRGQANVAVAVLLDATNTGNAAASMLEVVLKAGTTTGMRVTDRAELWVTLTDGELKFNLGKKGEHGDGSLKAVREQMIVFPKGAAREAVAGKTDFRALVVLLPGGREGTARAGALPTTAGPGNGEMPFIAIAPKTYGPATIHVDPTVEKLYKWLPASASILQLPAGANVPEHVHAGETELLYFLEGTGTITIAGHALPVSATSVVQIPPNTPHAFAATAAVRAVQLYTPAGPEQRFKKAK